MLLTALRRVIGAGLVLLSGVLPAEAAASDDLMREARAALARATTAMEAISTGGGYLWRYSPDLAERAGENPATASQVWVQNPGTPAMGFAFLRAHASTGEARYLEAAWAVGEALAAGQLASGGWDYLIEFDPEKRTAWYRRDDLGRISPEEAAKRRNVSTYDDDNTQQALRFLVALTTLNPSGDGPRDRRLREARDYGLAKLLEAQRPTDGWPQRWNGQPVDPAAYPVRSASFDPAWPRQHSGQPYYDHATLNDDTQRDCILTLLDAAEKLNRPDLRSAALRGGEFLLRAQLPEPQPAWAQQYDARMHPAWARAFEPPGVSSRESGGVINLLVDLYLETGETGFLEPLPRAIAWLRRSELAPGQWARLYEPDTNRPIFGDRDGKIYYAVEEISLERQTGYSWKSDFGLPKIMARAEEVMAQGREAYRTRQAAAKAADDPAKRAAALAPRVKVAIVRLDAQGRWLVPFRGAPAITTAAYIANVHLLCDYLDAERAVTR
ncbi:MAG TPA: pectate lyase [Opitutaceae bacterium]